MRAAVGRLVRGATVLALLLGAVSVPPAYADPMEVAGECLHDLTVQRTGNSLDIWSTSNSCVANHDGVDLDIQANVPAVAGWTCLGGAASGIATVTVSHGNLEMVAEEVGIVLTDVGGAVGVALQKIGGGQRVAIGGPAVEIVTGPLQCIFNIDRFVWRGALTVVAVEE